MSSLSRRKFLGVTGVAMAGAVDLLGAAAPAHAAEAAGSPKQEPGRDGIYRGRVWILGDGIWVDYLLTGAAMTMPLEEARKHCMEGIRPGWQEQVKPGDLLIGGKEFGTGSARDASVLLKYMGLVGLVAESIMPFFVRNSVNAGWPILECEGVSKLFKEGEICEFNLRTGVVKNLTTGKQLQGKPMPDAVNNIILDGGSAAVLKREGFV